MAPWGVSFHDYSLTLLITQRSVWTCLALIIIVTDLTTYRVLLSSIRYLTQHPCTRCLVTKQTIHELGMKRNSNVLSKQVRCDSISRRSSVQYARDFIYRQGRPVKCTAVENLLSSNSLVPTDVCIIYFFFLLHYQLMIWLKRMHSLHAFFHSEKTSMTFLWLTYCTNLN